MPLASQAMKRETKVESGAGRWVGKKKRTVHRVVSHTWRSSVFPASRFLLRLNNTNEWLTTERKATPKTTSSPGRFFLALE